MVNEKDIIYFDDIKEWREWTHEHGKKRWCGPHRTPFYNTCDKCVQEQILAALLKSNKRLAVIAEHRDTSSRTV